MRMLWAGLGGLALFLAVIGAALPVLPTVPFLLLAAFAFARSSPRMHDWLVNHPRFGRPIRDWQAHGAISGRVKVIASLSMAAGLAVGALLLPLPIWGVQAVIMALAATFVLTRPQPPLRL